LRSGDFEAAKEMLSFLLEKDPSNLVIQEYLAYALGGLGQELEALDLLKKVASDQNSPLSALYEYGALLLKNGNASDAIAPFERALKMAPSTFEVVHDLATAYACVGRRKEAIEKYELALKLSSGSSELFYNIGHLYDGLFDFERANIFYEKALAIDPLFDEARVNLGLNLCRSGRQKEGIPILEGVLKTRKNFDFLEGDVITAKMQVCSWGSFDQELHRIEDGVRRGLRVASPFVLLSLIDDPALQLMASKIYAQSKFSIHHANQLSLKEGRSKIRVGYFSSDFRNHAVANLTAELFELHDKNTFEIYAFSSGLKNNDAQKQRLEKSFDEFIDISGLSDEEAANLSRKKGIDIAVDLGGYTENSRIGIFERRAAPVQVSYLGFLGTLGVSHMDYIFADHEIIPAEYQQFYAEKVAYLPNCFQINDRQRVIPDTKFGREKFGLPNHGFVFCSFNNSYKITPEVFASWCRILQRVEGSVLWLYEANKGMVENLQVEALSRGVNPKRLVFSGTLPVPEYLARYRLADLFLDTFPYNAGTTASDALWAGLPVLTRSGKSFASRMAGSILKAINAPELITYTIVEYEDLAVELATNKPKLDTIREKIAVNRTSTPLFNSPQTTKNIEKAYHLMHERYLAGLNPAAINIA
jgi:predicted O-linked N-acetylglucosamine transferase (SPINDLY family)